VSTTLTAMCTMDWSAFFDAVKDIVLGLAAIVTATVAWLGLQSWRKELRGKADFDVARGLLRATSAARFRCAQPRLNRARSLT